MIPVLGAVLEQSIHYSKNKLSMSFTPSLVKSSGGLFVDQVLKRGLEIE